MLISLKENRETGDFVFTRFRQFNYKNQVRQDKWMKEIVLFIHRVVIVHLGATRWISIISFFTPLQCFISKNKSFIAVDKILECCHSLSFVCSGKRILHPAEAAFGYKFLFIFSSIQTSSELGSQEANNALVETEARFALGYPCHLQRLKSVPRRSPCLLLSPRWGMRQTASRHAKSVASGPDTTANAWMTLYSLTFRHIIVPVRNEEEFFVWRAWSQNKTKQDFIRRILVNLAIAY